MLLGCYSGDGKGSAAQVLSVENPNLTVVGATETVIYNKNGIIGTYDEKTKEKGKWNVYRNGKVIKSYEWNWKPNSAEINKLKNKSYEHFQIYCCVIVIFLL